jgi:hypothetical protein
MFPQLPQVLLAPPERGGYFVSARFINISSRRDESPVRKILLRKQKLDFCIAEIRTLSQLIYSCAETQQCYTSPSSNRPTFAQPKPEKVRCNLTWASLSCTQW